MDEPCVRASLLLVDGRTMCIYGKNYKNSLYKMATGLPKWVRVIQNMLVSDSLSYYSAHILLVAIKEVHVIQFDNDLIIPYASEHIKK